MDPNNVKITIRASVPSLQARAAEAAAKALGLHFNEFVQGALKEAIYLATLTQNADDPKKDDQRGRADETKNEKCCSPEIRPLRQSRTIKAKSGATGRD